jgi:GR25 family glycosyltransferase involved in LPS biosynthesis
MLIKVISLSRSVDRRKNFTKNNSHLDYEFFDAIDGRSLTDSTIEQSGMFESGLNYSPGAYGCAMSHMKLWDECLTEGAPLLIAEDDAIFRHDFQNAHDRLMKMLPDDWDFILWGWNFDAWLQLDLMPDIASTAIKFDQEDLRKNLTAFQQSTERPRAFRLKKAWGLPAYTVSPKGARKFRSSCTPLRSVQIPFDFSPDSLGNTGIDCQINLIYPETLSYAAFPPLVATPNLHSISTIQIQAQIQAKTQRQKSWLSRQARKIKNLYRPQI